jgi:hypothetical protein
MNFIGHMRCQYFSAIGIVNEISSGSLRPFIRRQEYKLERNLKFFEHYFISTKKLGAFLFVSTFLEFKIFIDLYKDFYRLVKFFLIFNQFIMFENFQSLFVQNFSNYFSM